MRGRVKVRRTPDEPLPKPKPYPIPLPLPLSPAHLEDVGTVLRVESL